MSSFKRFKVVIYTSNLYTSNVSVRTVFICGGEIFVVANLSLHSFNWLCIDLRE